MNVHCNHRALLLGAAAVLAGGLFAPETATAQTSGAWQTSASLYLYLPSVSGKTSYPADAGGTPINISTDQILDNLEMTFMGSMDVHNGRWGVFTDVTYLNFGRSRNQSSDFTIGDIGLPAGTTADLELDFEGWAWTLAGEYRLASDAGLTVDLIGGVRLLDVQQRLNWNITGSLGPLPPSSRTGTTEVSQTLWDGIVGVKGRYTFGAQSQWSLPFYADVGTGDSDLTWQAAAGVGYAFKWGDLTALWRYIDYEMKPGSMMQNIRFSGPMVGATFRW
jgi:hypothetical protein